MNDDESLEAVRAFISRYIDSVAQLEILLLVYGEPEKVWTAGEVADNLRVNLSSVMDELASLCSRGLLTRSPEGMHRYRFASAVSDLSQEVQNLSQVYSDRRVTVITLISSKPVDRIRVFTDAFKLRRDNPDA